MKTLSFEIWAAIDMIIWFVIVPLQIALNL